MKLHWKILIWLVAGVVVGGIFQTQLEGSSWIGVGFADGPQGARITRVSAASPAEKAGLHVGDVVTRVTLNRGREGLESVRVIASAQAAREAIATAANGDVIWIQRASIEDATAVSVRLDPECQRQRWIAPFAFVADIFLALLKMLIVPLILTSIITGVAGVGTGQTLRRLGLKTFAYYVTTSMLAIFAGLLLVNLIRPGTGAQLGLTPTESFEDVTRQSFLDVLRRMVPSNLFSSLTDNSQMLQVIFFALLFGYFITRTASPHRERIKDFFASAFEVMMKLAGFVLSLIPYGVFALLVKLVGETGFSLFRPLGMYMLTVTLGLLFHSLITLPLLLRFLGRISPLRWGQAMSPPLMTAFSTSSSSLTLPVTMEAVEHRGKVSHRTTSFVLPLGATINMDGTALYECIGVVFLAQYYSSIGGFVLTFQDQILVVVMALMASIGAAGIPSAGLVMMLTILSALELPIEGAALLLAVDRPLDMMRTMTNVWSDSCGAAMIARSEGETPLQGTPQTEPVDSS